MEMTKNVAPFSRTHPGEILAGELKSRRISQRDLSERIGLLPSHLNEILKGKRPISAEIALKLDWFFIGTADYWVNAQAQYELGVARKKGVSIQMPNHPVTPD